jgi:hypothetical protein
MGSFSKLLLLVDVGLVPWARNMVAGIGSGWPSNRQAVAGSVLRAQ